VHHGHMSHADGNGDWVLTIFTALSLVSNIYIRFVNFLSICFFCCSHNSMDLMRLPFPDSNADRCQSCIFS
jgi:hypothetical protein